MSLKIVAFAFLFTGLMVRGALAQHAHTHADEHAAEHGDHAHMQETDFGQPGDPSDVSRTIRVRMYDSYQFSPSEITIQTGEVVRFEVENAGDETHEMVLGTAKELAEHREMMKAHPGMKHDEPSMVRLSPGKRGAIVWQFTKPGEFSFACLVDDHYDNGMVGTIHVVGDAMAEHEHGHMTHAHEAGGMSGALGAYSMNRESSGTAWQPDSSPLYGIHQTHGDWMTMTHGFIDLIYDKQGGPRGDTKTFSTSMLMLMGQRSLGGGTLGLRGMLSADPLMGKSGYPLLFQTGETADGQTPLVDRQHPHDLFMELSASYSRPLSERSSVFVYAGLPGEPALGPPTFMHRFSGEDNPEAPISHHWLDSTHITYGVVTLGYVYHRLKLEGSLFRGREPDQNRYDIESGKLDSSSIRLSYNPTENWGLQVSRGHIKSPEQLEPDVDIDRTTASAIYNRPFTSGNWQTTFAWGRNAKRPGDTTNAYLLESAVTLSQAHTFFGRIERADKDELFPEGDPLAHQAFAVNKLSVGYVYDLPIAAHLKAGLGGLVSKYSVPSGLQSFYGKDPTSFMVFARLKIR